MEFLVEFLIEVFAELIVGGLGTIIAKLFSDLFYEFENDTRKKKIIKRILFSILFLIVIAFLIFSFIYKKGTYANVTFIYIGILLILYVLQYVNKSYLNDKIDIIIRIIKAITHLAFGVTIIVLAALAEQTASSLVIYIISSLSIIVMLIIDIFRIERALKNHKRKILSNDDDLKREKRIEKNKKELGL